MIPAISATAQPTTAKADAVDPKVLKAARDFEAIFIRQMLKSVEKTAAAGAGTTASPGESTYGSMVVGALSDAVSNAGGLGLADVIAKSVARAGVKPVK
jgi:flagellar protein FlgJ